MVKLNNKDLIDKLQAYLLTQNPEIVARLLANCMVDFFRLYTIKYLPFEEVESLFHRIEKNAISLREFEKKDKHEPLTMGPLK